MPIGTKRAILNTPSKSVPLSFARAGVAYDPYGNSVPANQPRFNNVAGKSGILIEESTTNLLTANASNFVAMGTVAQDGTGGTHTISNNVETLTKGNGTFTYEQITPYNASIPSGNVLTGQVTLLNDTTGQVLIRIMFNDGQYVNAIYTLDGSGNPILAFVTATANSTKTFARIDVCLGSAYSLSPSAPSVKFKMAQLELKAYPTSWVLGGTTRNAETLTIPSSVLNLNYGTIECEVLMKPSIQNTVRNVYLFAHEDGGQVNNRLALIRLANNTWTARMSNNTGNASNLTNIPDTFLNNTWHKFAMSWDINSYKVYFDGILVGMVNNPNLLNSFFINFAIGWDNISATGQIGTLIRNVSISKIKRTDADIQNRANQNTYPVDNQVSTFALLESDLRGVAKV